MYTKLVPGVREALWRGAMGLAAAALAIGHAGYAEAQQASVFTPKPVDPGVYIGAEGGVNWLLGDNTHTFGTGFAAGGVVGYDFVGARVELETVFRGNNGVSSFGNSGTVNQLSFMANAYYDFFPGATLTPYVGAGLGMAMVDGGLNCSLCNTEFAYQAIAGMSWNVDRQFRVSLDARYHGTTGGGGLPFQNNDVTTMLTVAYKFP